MAKQAREVYFTGGLPIRPAAKVFEALGEHVGALAPRYPDGDIAGWTKAVMSILENHPALEYSHSAPNGTKASVNPNGATPFYRLKEGRTVKDLTLESFGYAKTARESYQDFKRLREAGQIPARTRLEVTLPAPGTLGQYLMLPPEEGLSVARAALWREIQGILKVVPGEDLCIQLDFAGGDLAPQEYRRRPWAFDTPKQSFISFTMDQVVDASAWLANQIPADVEFGVHLCTLWKHDPRGGQDNEVLVEAANLLSNKITHPIAYMHFPIIPEHDKNSDYWPFKNLALHPETKVYLGLINLADGLEGAKRRIELAETAGGLSDFGVAFWCGLRVNPGSVGGGEDHPDPRLRRTPAKIDEVLDLHRQVAEL